MLKLFSYISNTIYFINSPERFPFCRRYRYVFPFPFFLNFLLWALYFSVRSYFAFSESSMKSTGIDTMVARRPISSCKEM